MSLVTHNLHLLTLDKVIEISLGTRWKVWEREMEGKFGSEEWEFGNEEWEQLGTRRGGLGAGLR